MPKDTEKAAPVVQAYQDFGQFLSDHRQGQAIKTAAQQQGVVQLQPEDPCPLVDRVRKPPRQ